MKQKGTRRRLCAVLTLLLCLQTIFSPGMPGSSASVQAASSKVQFASSLRSSVKKSAKKAGADTSRIAVAKVVNYTNIYSQAGEQGTLKGRLYKGAAAYIIRTSGDFCYISSGELTGWAKKKCLVTGTEAKNLVKKNNPRVATVKSSTLNIRSAASSNSQILGELTKGTSVIVTSSSSKWVKVRLTNNDYGYIYKKYAKVESGLYSGVTIAQERKMESLLNEESAQQDANGKNEPEKTDVTKTQETGTEETKVEETKAEVTKTDTSDGNWVSLGTFKLTAYCPCAQCNGAANVGKTATGAPPVPGHTIAVDRRVIPLGSKIKIEGFDNVFVAEDTGVSGNSIDILFATHAETGEFGVKYREAYILK